MNTFSQQLVSGKKDLVLVGTVVGVLMMLFIPIPPILLDFLLIVNFSFALLVLLLTFYTDKPLSFSTFPSLLLITTLFRLALNISATRLILEGADAGKVIGAIGSYVVGGNYLIGIIVFLILVVVQYVVITNGAQRVAEVAARFTLDSMPGKQMSIDADMNMGLIDDKEAKKRRSDIEREANFYGAMDGASKFVKGDAIAGIILIFINIIGGLTVGIVQNGMSWGDAMHTYTLLTVGDGIVTQIPSLIIAVATGIIITRAASDSYLGEEVARQISSHPKTLAIVATALFLLLFLPGLPILPVLPLFITFALMTYYTAKAKIEPGKTVDQEENNITPPQAPEDLYELIRVDPIEIRVGRELSTYIKNEGDELMARLQTFRKQYALEFGLVIPQVRIKDDMKLSPNNYVVSFHGSQIASGEIQPANLLAINPGGQRPPLEGEETREPTYGLPARWISPDHRNFARSAGYTLVEPQTVLITHFSELVKRHAADLLSRSETEKILTQGSNSQSGLLEELIPNLLSYSEIQKILQLLLQEKVSIRNTDSILEVLVEHSKQIKSAEELVEKVRERLGSHIYQGLSDPQGELHVLTLEPEFERSLMVQRRHSENGVLFQEPSTLEQFLTNLARNCEGMMNKNRLPVLLCASPLRRSIRRIADRVVPHLAVLSLNELPTTAKVRTFAVVGVQNIS